MTIRVVLADDQGMVRTALAMMIALEPDIDVVGEAATCAEAAQLVAATRPDVVLMDVQMPSGLAPGARGPADGIEVTRLIHEQHPGVRVVVLTTFGRPGYLRRTMEAGASGFMVKDSPAQGLVDAIRRTHQGLRVIDPELAAASLAIGPSPLSSRETDVLRAAARGDDTSQIAAGLFLSEGTVRNHLSQAIGKTGTTNRVEAVRVATDNGWL